VNALTTLPVRLLRTLPERGARALSNARSATLDLSASMADRLVLTGMLDDGEPEEGSLRSMTSAECEAVLVQGSVGRLAYIARAGVPDIAPVNYTYVGGDIFIRSGPGPKLQAAERRDRVAFEVDEIDSALRTGRSVVVAGIAVRVHVDDDGDLPQPWASGPRNQLIRITPRRVTGRALGDPEV